MQQDIFHYTHQQIIQNFGCCEGQKSAIFKRHYAVLRRNMSTSPTKILWKSKFTHMWVPPLLIETFVFLSRCSWSVLIRNYCKYGSTSQELLTYLISEREASGKGMLVYSFWHHRPSTDLFLKLSLPPICFLSRKSGWNYWMLKRRCGGGIG